MGLEKGVVGKIALRWKEEMPKIFTSCGENYNYSIDKTGDQIWAGVFEKDKPNEAVRCSTFADEKAAREFCKKIEADGKLPLCMGRGAAKETITLPEYGKELQDISGSGKLPKGYENKKQSSRKVAYNVDPSVADAVVNWLKRDVLYDYDHEQALEDHSDYWWQLVEEALKFDLYDQVYDRLEQEGIENTHFSSVAAIEDVITPANILRDLIIDEQEAIQGYDSAIELIEDEDVSLGLAEIRDEEKAHVGELQKWLEIINPSEETNFNEGQEEVDSEDEKMATRQQVKTSMKKKVALRNKIAASVYDLSTDIERDLETDGPFADENEVEQYIMDAIDSNLIYDDDIFEYAQEYLRGGDILDKFVDNLIGDVMGNIGDLSRFVEEDDDDYYALKKSAKRGGYFLARKRLARKLAKKLASAIENKKTATADLAKEVGRHDVQRTFYAYYEGNTKDKKASIAVAQEDLGSHPRLIVCSNQGKLLDFGLFANMDYAMRQAELFEKMSFAQVAAVAPTQKVRVASKVAVHGEWEFLDDSMYTKYLDQYINGDNVLVHFEGFNDVNNGNGVVVSYEGENEYIEIARIPVNWFGDDGAINVFDAKEKAMEKGMEIADQWVAENYKAASKTAQNGEWEESDGFWAKYVEPFEIEIDYDYYVPGKYHWEVADMSQSLAGKVVADGSCDTLEQAQKEALDYID